MSQAAPDLHGNEFWKAPELKAQTAACEQCGTEFVIGARFCHVCGNGRQPALKLAPGRLSRLAEVLEFAQIRDSLGMRTAALVAFVFGAACLIAAVVTGFMFTATTLLDWQAVQIWRIEWLLAAAVLFLGGILLNREPNR